VSETVTAFAVAVDLVFLNEGSLNLDADEPGGRTAHGIAEKHHPEAWADGAPTKADAEAIYRREYWERAGCPGMPPAIACAVLDYAVQSGVSRAVRELQRVLGVAADGVVGPRTLEACQSAPDKRTALMLCDRREAFLMRLADASPVHKRRRRGYINRMARTRTYVSKNYI
jgi:lysozyme family protein